MKQLDKKQKANFFIYNPRSQKYIAQTYRATIKISDIKLVLDIKRAGVNNAVSDAA